jgi:hypothetical protein
MSVAPLVIVASVSLMYRVNASDIDVMGDRMKLKDKVALVTGSSPNIGGASPRAWRPRARASRA